MRRVINGLKVLYEWVWRHTSDRPWTYSIRDWTSRHPNWAQLVVGVVVAMGVSTQVATVRVLGFFALPAVVFWDFMAFVAGHLFWGGRGSGG